MSDENKKDSAELREKLNKKLTNSGARFTSVKKVEEGQYQLLVSVDRQFFADQSYRGNEKSKFVIPRQPEPGSLLERFKLNSEAESLEKRLYIGYLKDQLNNPGKEVSRLDQRFRDTLSNSYIDNRKAGVEEAKANELYVRSESEYYKTGIYGTSIDLLSNLSATGFYNEIDDPIIKEYYDSWINDINFIYVVKKILHSLFKYSVCYVLKSYGTYEPHSEGISSIPGKIPEKSSKAGLKANVAFTLNEVFKKLTGEEMSFEKFNLYYKEEAASSHPLYYSIVDPRYTTVQSPGFFDSVTVTIQSKGLESLREIQKLLKESPEKVSKTTKDMLKYLPSGLKKAAEENKDYTFKDEEISVIYLRKDDYYKYAKPRGSRAFDSFDYKEELKKADFATVDGIYNYILKVTIGDKDNPVTDEKILEDLAEAFNTPQKAFTIVWNHTLQIEKITANEVGAILGKAKYEPVEMDISAALGITRALIDGTNISGDAATLAAKATQSEIENARQQVEDWIYNEYRNIAKAAGFNTYPVVRWKHTVVTTDGDAVTRASYMQMLDRKAISIQTYMREMGFDYDTEKNRMEEEYPLIYNGILQAGSPFQKGSMPMPPPLANPEDYEKPPENLQPVQSPVTVPSGDSGRPKGQPTSTKKPINKEKVVKRNTKVKSPSQQGTEEKEILDNYIEDIVSVLSKLDPETKVKLLSTFTERLKVD